MCRDFGRETLTLTQSQVDALRNYAWPGNVRELKNVIERAVILSNDRHLRLDLSMPEARLDPPNVGEPSDIATGEPTFLTDEVMRDRVRLNLIAALEYADWRVSGQNGAARLLGLKPTTLTDRIHAMDIERPDTARSARGRRSGNKA